MGQNIKSMLLCFYKARKSYPMNILGSVGGFVQYCFGLLNKDVTTHMETSILSCSPSNLASLLTLFFLSFSFFASQIFYVWQKKDLCWRLTCQSAGVCDKKKSRKKHEVFQKGCLNQTVPVLVCGSQKQSL